LESAMGAYTVVSNDDKVDRIASDDVIDEGGG
jgi:hypothetical protein